ncbi:unnamed protein product [Phytomonas sp. Hart1]|nr:unnamed protein product [Phytomonas sp. Hart1]|eukprot:CCW72235.1 unnamed protein product [Phytomonas sp. isolate Hart1]
MIWDRYSVGKTSPKPDLTKGPDSVGDPSKVGFDPFAELFVEYLHTISPSLDEELPEKDLKAVIALDLRLMDSSIPEVRNAAAIFARMALRLMKRRARVRTAVEKSPFFLLYTIALVTSQSQVSGNVRVFLEEVLKRFGYTAIDPIFSIGSKNSLRYTHKMIKLAADGQNEFDCFFMGTAMRAGGGGGGEIAVEDDADDRWRREALTDRLLRCAPGKRPRRADTGQGKGQPTSRSCVNKRRRDSLSSGCACRRISGRVRSLWGVVRGTSNQVISSHSHTFH